MARPTKQGLDYFPLDCQFDDKIELYLMENGATGLAVLISIWQLIYSNEGYYINENSDLHLRIKREINVDINEVIACINSCLCRHIFDQEMFENYKILTSKAIQKRYFEAAKRKKIINVNKNYVYESINAGENWVYVGQQSLNVKGKGNVNVKGDVKGDIPNQEGKLVNINTSSNSGRAF